MFKRLNKEINMFPIHIIDITTASSVLKYFTAQSEKACSPLSFFVDLDISRGSGCIDLKLQDCLKM